LQDWAGVFVANLTGVKGISASATGKIEVAEIQFDDRAPAFANKGWAAISEAGFNPFEAECLNSAAVVEFDAMECEANA
jgi:hypothetical protein